MNRERSDDPELSVLVVLVTLLVTVLVTVLETGATECHRAASASDPDSKPGLERSQSTVDGERHQPAQTGP